MTGRLHYFNGGWHPTFSLLSVNTSSIGELRGDTSYETPTMQQEREQDWTLTCHHTL